MVWGFDSPPRHHFYFMHFPTHIWNPAGLLEVTPPLTWAWQWYYIAFLVFCALLLTAAYYSRLPALLAKPLRRIAFNNLWIGLLLLFFRLERVPVLGMDVWRIIQECAIVTLLVLTFLHFRKNHPKNVLSARVEAYRNRFLPKARPRP